MKKHLHQKSFPMGQTRCSWLYSFRNDSLNCDRDKSREITTTEPPHLYILLFFASQLLNILFDFCGVSTIRFLSLSSSFCLKKLKIHQKKVELWGEEKMFGFFCPTVSLICLFIYLLACPLTCTTSYACAHLSTCNIAYKIAKSTRG